MARSSDAIRAERLNAALALLNEPQSLADAAATLVAEVAERFDEYLRLAERLDEVSGDERLRGERIDLLRFQTAEILAAGLSPGERVIVSPLRVATEGMQVRTSASEAP